MKCERRALAFDRGAATDLRNVAGDEAVETGGDVVAELLRRAVGSIFDGP